VKFIKAQVIRYEQEDDNTGGDANGKPQNINERIIFITQKIPKGKNKIVSDHVVAALFFISRYPKTVPTLYRIDFQTLRHEL
jgi:hypothetical protein